MSDAPMTVGTQVPSNVLELRAAEQRRRIHNSIAELKDTVRERADIRKVARQYLWPAAGVAAVAGLVLGYGMGGIFTAH